MITALKFLFGKSKKEAEVKVEEEDDKTVLFVCVESVKVTCV
jgi:hypothetical protein